MAKMVIGYLTTTYPEVSHTFIRRELREIESRGNKVVRVAIRKSKVKSVDPADQKETSKTIHCLSLPAIEHIKNLIKVIRYSPAKFIKTFCLAIKMGFKSGRDIHKYLAYFFEACTIFNISTEFGIQHFHVHFGTNPCSVARLSLHLGGPTYSFTVHGPAEFDDPIGIDLEGKIKDASFVIAITDFCSAQLRRWASYENWVKIHVVRCTVGDEFFDTLDTINVNSKTFVCVGRLAPQKGQLVLVDSLKKVLDEGYDANLVLVGDGELRSIIEKKIIDNNMQSKITITGFLSEKMVREHIKNSRALVLPSFAEGLPMVIMEAFAVGRPVISTFIAGIPELVLPHENGWLVPAGNTNELAGAMIEVLEAPAERLMEMAAHGKALTYKNHRTLTEGERLEKLFLRCIEGDPPAS